MRLTKSVYGVDFSGARRAGEFIWIARFDLRRGRLRLADLNRLDRLCGAFDRASALRHLVDVVRESTASLWAIDMPFGFPIEVPGGSWRRQFGFLRQFGDDAYAAGLACLNIARSLGLPLHVRRTTDVEARTPFDCYHYRIIYQSFFGMRDVLGPLRGGADTAVLPFQYRKLATAARVLIETCPSSTLKRLGLPHHSYKQPAGGPLTAKRRTNRRLLVDAVSQLATISVAHQRVMMRDPGGDALDAVIAGVGGWQAYSTCDHAAIARHPRYPKEGRLFV